jgi:hypothetical protein
MRVVVLEVVEVSMPLPPLEVLQLVVRGWVGTRLAMAARMRAVRTTIVAADLDQAQHHLTPTLKLNNPHLTNPLPTPERPFNANSLISPITSTSTPFPSCNPTLRRVQTRSEPRNS